MTKENNTNKYLGYGRLEFTVGEVAKEKEKDTIFAVYCDESVEGEFPHDKLVGIFKTRKEAENCVHTQNILHSISKEYYYNFRVEEISTLSKPKEVEKYQAETRFYYFDTPQYDKKKVHSYIWVIEKDDHKDGEVLFEEGNESHASKWKVIVFLDLDEKSTREEVIKKSKKLADDYLIEKGLISEPFE